MRVQDMAKSETGLQLRQYCRQYLVTVNIGMRTDNDSEEQNRVIQEAIIDLELGNKHINLMKKAVRSIFPFIILFDFWCPSYSFSIILQFCHGVQIRGTQYNQFKRKALAHGLLKDKQHLLHKAKFIYKGWASLDSDGNPVDPYGPYLSPLLLKVAQATWSGKRCLLWSYNLTNYDPNTLAWLCTMIHFYIKDPSQELHEVKFCDIYAKYRKPLDAYWAMPTYKSELLKAYRTVLNPAIPEEVITISDTEEITILSQPAMIPTTPATKPSTVCDPSTSAVPPIPAESPTTAPTSADISPSVPTTPATVVPDSPSLPETVPISANPPPATSSSAAKAPTKPEKAPVKARAPKKVIKKATAADALISKSNSKKK